MRMHPAGKALRRSDNLPTVHRVARGESLWTIAEEALGTQDPVRVARYWHRIHRTNRDVIGADPNLLLPGQHLTLPTEKA
jgi:nucleoid-associated protein YgaU